MASEKEEGLEEEEAEFDEEYAAAEEFAPAEAEFECGVGSSDEDGAAGGSFQSADEDDDFDLPQDIVGLGCDEDAAAQGAASSSGGALPPGLDAGDGGGAERWNLRQDGNKEQLEAIFQRLCGDREHVKISKMFSYVLRHAAHKLDVRIRKDGFVRLREIMKLRNFKPYQLEELMAVVYFDEKERYTMVREFDGELLIRANQGHTMKVVEDELLLETIVEPGDANECVHGTYLVHWPFIKRQGLSKVARNHIHLASGLPEDGKIRGMRSTAELFIYLNVRSAMEDGVVFYRSKNDVILTQGFDGWLPVKYFIKAVRIDYNTCDIEELEFDHDCGGIPQWPAELAPSGPGEQGTYLIKNLEALISNCRKRMQEINELKALQDRGTELDEEDQETISKHAQVYTELQSLEQRFRQHKGFRRDNATDKEQRAKEVAEATTVVKRKDRALTPPWLKGKVTTESVSMRSTEKEKAEWAALGRRRDTATDNPKPPKKEDQWSVLGRGRQSAPTTPAGGSGGNKGSEAELWRSRSGALSREGGSRTSLGGKGKSAGRSEEERRGGKGKGSHDDKMRSGGNAGDDSSTAGGNAGPPRFFNSRKSAAGPSWRDRLTNPKSSEDERRPSPQPSQDSEPSWRDQMQDGSDTWNDPMDQQTWGEVAANHRHDAAWRDQAAQPQEEQSWRRPSQLGQTMHVGGPPGQDPLQTPTHRDFPPPPPQVPAPVAMPPSMPNQAFHLVMQPGSNMTTMVPSQMQSPMSPQGGGMVQVMHGPGPGPSSPGGSMQGMMQNQFAMPMNSGGSPGGQLAGSQSPCNSGNLHETGMMQQPNGGMGSSSMDSARGGYIAVPVWPGTGTSMQAGQQACNLGSAQPQMFCSAASPTGASSPMAPASWLGPAPQATQFMPPPPPDAPPDHSPEGSMPPPPPTGPSGGQCMGNTRGHAGDSMPMQQQQQQQHGQGVGPGGAGVMPAGGGCRPPMQQTPRSGFGSNRARYMQLQQCPGSGFNFNGGVPMGNDGGGMQLHHIPGGGNFGCGNNCGGGGDFAGMSSPTNYGYGCDGRMAMDASPMSPMSYTGEDSMQGPGGCFGCGGCNGCMDAQSDMNHHNRASGGMGYPMPNWEPVTPHTPQMKGGGGGCRYQMGAGAGADAPFLLQQQPYGDFDDAASLPESSHGPSWSKGGGGGKTPQHGGGRGSGGKGSKKGGKGKGGGDGGGKGGRGSQRDRGSDSQDWAALGRLRSAAT